MLQSKTKQLKNKVMMTRMVIQRGKSVNKNPKEVKEVDMKIPAA